MGVSLNGGTPNLHTPRADHFSRKKPMVVVGETHHFRKPPYICNSKAKAIKCWLIAGSSFFLHAEASSIWFPETRFHLRSLEFCLFASCLIVSFGDGKLKRGVESNVDHSRKKVVDRISYLYPKLLEHNGCLLKQLARKVLASSN